MTTETLNVSGMTCGGCVAKVTRAISAVPGVNHVVVSLPNHTATVKFDQGRTSVEVMGAALHSAGYGTGETPVKKEGGGCCG